MLASSSQFTLDLDGLDMMAAFTVQIDLPGGVFPDVSLAVTALSVEESATTDQPERTRTPVGYPEVLASVTLAGIVDPTDETRTAAWLFNPYRTDSPLYRKKVRGSAVRIYLGLVPTGAGSAETLRKFVGSIDSFTYDPAAGTVALSCIDRRNELRSSASVPAVVTAPPYNAGLTSEFAVDALLRSATSGAVSSWPAQRPNCVLAVGFRASTWPEVGTLNTGTSLPDGLVFTAGAFGTAISGASLGGVPGFINYTLAAPVTGTVYFEWWTTGVAPGLLSQVLFGGATDHGSVQVQDFALSVSVGAAGDTWTLPVSSGSHHVAVALTLPAVGGTGYTGTAWIDGASHSVSFTTTARVDAAWTLVQANPGGASIGGLQVTTEAAPTYTAVFAPGAVLDPSLNPLTVIPAIDGDPWQTIQQIADAEQAVAGWDQAADVFRFTNRDSIRTGTVARSITSAMSLLAMQIGVDGAGFYDRVTIPYTTWSFDARATIWSLTDVKRVPRGSTITFGVTLDALAAGIDTTVDRLPDTGAVVGASYFRTSADRYGTQIGPYVFVRIAQTSATELSIRVINPSGIDAWLVSSAGFTDLPVGTPVLQIGGIPVTPAAEQNVTQTTGLGTTVYAGQSNPWIQDPDTADRIAVDLLSSLATDRPNLTGTGIVPDPRLQLIDRVLIVDPDVTGVNEYAVLFGQTIGLSSSDYSHTVDARAVTFPGGWILGVAGRTELAVTTNI